MTMLLILVGALMLLGGALFLYITAQASMYPENVRTQEIHHVDTPDLCKLRLCRYRTGRSEGEPVLLLPGIGMSQHIFTSPDSDALVDFLAQKGYDCWCMEWRGSRSSSMPFEYRLNQAGIDDYLFHDLPAVVGYILKHTSYKQLHWIGYGMGGTLVYAFAHQFGTGTMASAVTLGSPIHADMARDLSLPAWAMEFLRRLPGLAVTLLRAYAPLGRTSGYGTRPIVNNLEILHPKINAHHFFNLFERPAGDALDEIVALLKNPDFRLGADGISVRDAFETFQAPLLAFVSPMDPFVSVNVMRESIAKNPSQHVEQIVLAECKGFKGDYGHWDYLWSKHSHREVYKLVLSWLEAYNVDGWTNPYAEEYKNNPGYAQPLKGEERQQVLSHAGVAPKQTAKSKESAAARAALFAAREGEDIAGEGPAYISPLATEERKELLEKAGVLPHAQEEPAKKKAAKKAPASAKPSPGKTASTKAIKPKAAPSKAPAKRGGAKPKSGGK